MKGCIQYLEYLCSLNHEAIEVAYHNELGCLLLSQLLRAKDN